MKRIILRTFAVLALSVLMGLGFANPPTAVLASGEYNTPFLTDAQLENYGSMNVTQIRQFLASKGSYYRQSVKDADGTFFDAAQVIADATTQYRINPQVLLVTMQKESSAVTSGGSGSLSALMGCGGPSHTLPVPGGTARWQLWCAAERFRSYQDQLNSGGATVSGWRVGVAKQTVDRITVTPATKAVAGQFTYTPYAGANWGGSNGGVWLFYNFWTQWGFGSGGGVASCSTPSGYYCGEYYNNRSLGGSPTFTRSDSTVNFDWGGGGPGNGVGNDNFSARWQGSFSFTAGNYTFTAATDDGMRVYVDGNLIVDKWFDQGATTYSAIRSMSSGNHTIKVEYYENGGNAVARVNWQPQAFCSSSAYTAQYYDNQSLSGSPRWTNCEGWPIDHDWGSGGPGNGIPNDHFSARWTGRTNIPSGSYDFIATSDDGMRVWLDNSLIIDMWRDQAPTTTTRTLYVNGGDHDVKVEYYENGGGAVAKFRWQASSGGGISTTTWYSVVNKNSHKCVDSRNSGTANGTVIQQYSCNNSYAQQFQFQSTSGGYYRLNSRNAGSQVWDVNGASTADGAKVQLWGWNGGNNQQWLPVSEGSGYYHFVARHSGKCLDVPGSSTADSIQLQQWSCNGTGAQSFSLTAH